MQDHFLLLGKRLALEKTAAFLVLLLDRTAEPLDGTCRIRLPMNRTDIADYLGLTLETVSRQISALKRDGVIELEGKRHVTVPDYNRLLEEAGDDADGGFFG